MNKEVATLFLMTNTLATTPNQYGFKTSNLDYTFFVDMRNWLGEMLWNNYDQYIVNFSYMGPAGTGPTMFINFICNGLNIINTSTNGEIRGNPLLGVTYYPAAPTWEQNRGAWVPFDGGIGLTMIKPDTQLANLRIQFENVGGVATLPLSQIQMFILTARGVEPKMKMYKNLLNDFYTKESRNFNLNTIMLTAGGTNQYGTMNAQFSQFTFSQVPIRQILGTLWDKYTKFNIVATSFTQGPFTSTLNISQGRIIWIISGFQVINSLTLGVNNTTSYNQYVILPESNPEVLIGNSFTSTNNFGNQQATFTIRKPESDLVNLQFTITNCSGNQQPNSPNTAVTRGHVNFNFIVVGVE
jgi:hypothetical protein